MYLSQFAILIILFLFTWPVCNYFMFVFIIQFYYGIYPNLFRLVLLAYIIYSQFLLLVIKIVLVGYIFSHDLLLKFFHIFKYHWNCQLLNQWIFDLHKLKKHILLIFQFLYPLWAEDQLFLQIMKKQSLYLLRSYHNWDYQ
jgi:hypothetical protein